MAPYLLIPTCPAFNLHSVICQGLSKGVYIYYTLREYFWSRGLIIFNESYKRMCLFRYLYGDVVMRANVTCWSCMLYMCKDSVTAASFRGTEKKNP